MPLARRHVSWLAAGWVLLQLAAFVTAPVVLSARPRSDAAPLEHCTCPDAVPGRACPMHHGRTPDKQSDCKLRNPCIPSDAALLSLAGLVGLIPLQAATDVACLVVSIPASF